MRGGDSSCASTDDKCQSDQSDISFTRSISASPACITRVSSTPAKASLHSESADLDSNDSSCEEQSSSCSSSGVESRSGNDRSSSRSASCQIERAIDMRQGGRKQEHSVELDEPPRKRLAQSRERLSCQSSDSHCLLSTSASAIPITIAGEPHPLRTQLADKGAPGEVSESASACPQTSACDCASRDEDAHNANLAQSPPIQRSFQRRRKRRWRPSPSAVEDTVDDSEYEQSDVPEQKTSTPTTTPPPVNYSKLGCRKMADRPPPVSPRSSIICDSDQSDREPAEISVQQSGEARPTPMHGSGEMETEMAATDGSDSSDDLTYHDAAHMQMRRDSAFIRKSFGSSSLTPLSHSRRKRKIWRNDATAKSPQARDQSMLQRSNKATTVEDVDSDTPLINACSKKPLLDSSPSSPPHPQSRRATPSRTSTCAMQDKPASYTRSRTAAPTSDSIQCHQCEVFHAKLGTLLCVTCDRGLCDVCLCQNYSESPFYYATRAFLFDNGNRQLGQNGDHYRNGKKRLTEKLPASREAASESSLLLEATRPSFTPSCLVGPDMNDDPQQSHSSQQENFSAFDISKLDFQCPVCKQVCNCANCLRGPFPKTGTVRNKVPAPRLTSSSGAHDEPYDYSHIGDRDIETSPVDVPVIQTSSHGPTDPDKSNPKTVRGSLGLRRRPRRVTSTRNHCDALAAAAALRAALDRETDYVPVVAARKTPNHSGPSNTVPRYGSPRRHRLSDSGVEEPREETSTFTTASHNARVRLATKVGQQLGKSPASLLKASSSADSEAKHLG